MNKIQFDKLLKPLIALYDEIELDLIMNILERIDNYSEIKGSLEWYLDKLSEMKLLDKDDLKVFKKNKRKIKQIIADIADNCANNIDNLEQLNDYYEKDLITVNPVNLYNSTAINNLFTEAIKDSEDVMNLINTKALEGAKESYKKVLNKAYLETASGTYSYTESIRRAINEMAQQGIKIVNYESGVQLSIEAVVRRDVVTRMNKLVGDCGLEHAKQLETNLVYVDQHLGARVRTKYMKNDYEAHCEWQGKKYMINSSSKDYPNLYEATGYGEMLGLKGINCYHNMRPTWEWETIPDVIDEVENAIEYEKLQRQRSLERKMRELKRKKEVAKYFNDKDEIKKLDEKSKKFNKEYNSWLEENDLTRDYNREYIVESESKTRTTYIDLTKQLKSPKETLSLKERRLDYSIDSNNNKHYDFFFEDDNRIKEEIECRKRLEELTGYKVYLNPKTHSDGYKTPDFWIEDTEELWDLKGIDGNSKNVIDNILHNASDKFQTSNLILKQRKTSYETDYLKEKIKEIFEKNQRQKIKQVILLDKNSNVIVYYKR